MTFKIDLTIDETQGCTELLVAIKEATDPKQTAGYSKALKNYLLRAEQVYLHGYSVTDDYNKCMPVPR